MKRSKEVFLKHKVVIVMAVLLILTVIAAVFHLRTRENIAEGTLLVTVGDASGYLDISEFSYIHVTGVRMNGKGEEIPVDAPGIPLSQVLQMVSAAEYETVMVISDDSYQAELSAEETTDETKAYLIADDEKRLRLVVFGDTNSKRSVTNVVQITAK